MIKKLNRYFFMEDEQPTIEDQFVFYGPLIVGLVVVLISAVCLVLL